MDPRLLRTFIAVVESRGFARAAEALGCAQPTVSAQVAALEGDLGTTLFYRDRRPVRLTPQGEALLVHARTILNEIEAARDSVAGLLGTHRGTVRLGTYSSATAGYVPQLLQQFAARFPQVSVRLVELGSGDMEDAAIGGEVTLFLRQTLPPLSGVLFDRLPLWREDFKVVIPPGHPLARSRRPLSPAALLKYGLVMTGHDVTDGLAADPFWRSLGEPPNVVYEVTQPQSLIELVRAGIGIGVLNQLALDVSRAEGLVTRAIAHPEAVREVAVYWLRSRALSAAATALLDFMAGEMDVPKSTKSVKQRGRPSFD